MNLNRLPINREISVREMTRTNYRSVKTDATFHDAVSAYMDVRRDTLPVVDDAGHLVGVLPRWCLYQALLDGKGMQDPIIDYCVKDPIVNYASQTYTVSDMMEKANHSPVQTVPVLDDSGNVYGILSGNDYFRETLQVLEESLAFLDATFRDMDESMIVIDNGGNILMMNRAAETMFQTSSKDSKGKSISTVLEQADFRHLSFDDAAYIRRRYESGSLKAIIHAVPVKIHQRQLAVNLVIQDVSKLEDIAKELDSTLALQATLAGVLNASSEGVIVTDKEGTIRFVNKKGATLFGLTAKDMTGNRVVDYLSADSVKKAIEDGGYDAEVCHINNTPYLVSSAPFHAKSVSGEESEDLFGVVYTVFSGDNRQTEDIARNWFSLKRQIKYYRSELEKHGIQGVAGFDGIITHNPRLLSMKEEASRIARSTSTVLLTGESGVGKDMFARAIHAASPRSKHPFVKVNCAAIPEALMESELFGYAPNSFTGASRQGKPGYFKQADHGTIFLDEIGDMPLSLQVKILQVLQDKKFQRVGGTDVEEVDVRIISATNRNLKEAIREGEFREDLFYRLSVIEMTLPPLRKRPEDIIPLAEMFIEKYNEILQSHVVGMSKEAEESLLLYQWPGNIRELENAIERAANYVWEGEITLNHLPPDISGTNREQNRETGTENSAYRNTLENVDKEIILNALKVTGGNKSAAARFLKLSRSAFYGRLQKYGIT